MNPILDKVHRLSTRYGIIATVVLVTTLSVIVSVFFTVSLILITNQGDMTIGVILAIICPLIIAPVVMWFYLSLNRKLEESNVSLRDALAEVKELKGLLPICAWCKNIRDDKGYWRQIESYISYHTGAEFSHSICPDCRDKNFNVRKKVES